MSSQKRKPVIRRDPDIDFREAPAYVVSSTLKKIVFVRMGPARDNGKSTQNRHVNICVPTTDVFPVGIVLAFGFEGSAEFQKSVRPANFLEGQHVGVHCPNTLSYLALGFGR